MTITSNSVTITVKAVAPTLGSLTLSYSASTIEAGGSITFAAVARSTTGTLMEGIPLTLLDTTTGTTINMGNTDASGSAAVNVTFNTAGTYVVYAEN